MSLEFSIQFTAALIGVAAALRDWGAAFVTFLWLVVQLLVQHYLF